MCGCVATPPHSHTLVVSKNRTSKLASSCGNGITQNAGRNQVSSKSQGTSQRTQQWALKLTTTEFTQQNDTIVHNYIDFG